MKKTILVLIVVTIGLAMILWGIVAYEFSRNSVRKIVELNGVKYESVEFTLGDVIWNGRYVLGPILNFHTWVNGYEPGAFAGGCERSIAMYSRRLDG
jgi:hypothetical protein